MGMSVSKENIESYDNKYVKDKWFFFLQQIFIICMLLVLFIITEDKILQKYLWWFLNNSEGFQWNLSWSWRIRSWYFLIFYKLSFFLATFTEITLPLELNICICDWKIIILHTEFKNVTYIIFSCQNAYRSI